MESSLRDERHNDPRQGEAISAAVGASDSDRAILRSTAAMRFDELVEAPLSTYPSSSIPERAWLDQASSSGTRRGPASQRLQLAPASLATRARLTRPLQPSPPIACRPPRAVETECPPPFLVAPAATTPPTPTNNTPPPAALCRTTATDPPACPPR